jgi:hypothetical protein
MMRRSMNMSWPHLLLIAFAICAAPASSSFAGVVVVNGSLGATGTDGSSQEPAGGVGGRGGDATATTTTPGDSTNTATASGGQGGAGGNGASGGNAGAGGPGGSATASAVTSSSSNDSVTSAIANGGTGGAAGKPGTGGSPASGGAGGAASANVTVNSNGGEFVFGQATAVGGTGGSGGAGPSGAAGSGTAVTNVSTTGYGAGGSSTVRNASSGNASVNVASLAPGDAVTLTALSPVGGASAPNAVALGYANDGDFFGVPSVAGRMEADGTILPGGGIVGFGAGYGGSGQPLTYSATADLSFTLTAKSKISLLVEDVNANEGGFTQLVFSYDVNGIEHTYSFTSPSAAEQALSDTTLYLGTFAAGTQTADFSFSMTGNTPGDHFFLFAAVETVPAAVPELPSLAMVLLGFCAVGALAARRREVARSSS